MRAKYSIPKISKTTHLWYVHFRYEGKQYRYKLHYNQIKDLKERQKEFDSFCWELKEKLKNGWYPNKVEKKKSLSFDMFSKQEKTKFLNELLNNNLKSKVIKKINTTPKHENIFCNNGFILFDYILKEYVRLAKGRQTDLLFYYWKMYDNEPQYIHQRPTEFFIWFDKEYLETSGQLKTYNNVKTTSKEKDFSLALDWFKLQNL